MQDKTYKWDDFLVDKTVVKVGDENKARVGRACTRPGSKSLHKTQLDLRVCGLHRLFDVGMVKRLDDWRATDA